MPSRRSPLPAPAALLVREAQEALDGGDFEHARDVATRALHAADRAPESGVRASARRVLALALSHADEPDEAARIAEEAVRVARGARTSIEESLCELALAEVLRARGDHLDSLRHAARARSITARSEEAATGMPVLAEHALLLSRLGDDERARDVFDDAFETSSAGQTPARAFRVLHDAAMMHRSAGRFDRALRTLEHAEQVVRTHGLAAMEWSLVAGRSLVYVDIGDLELARAPLTLVRDTASMPGWQRAELLGLRAAIALLAGDKPEKIEKLAIEGLALPHVRRPTRFLLERLRARALLARGRPDEAERIAILLTGLASKGGTRAEAAQAMALAGRAGNRDAWVLRWLGALGLASGGACTLTEHECLAAIAAEPDPTGAFARMCLGVVRARLIDRAPPALRAALKHTLRQVESRLTAQRRVRRVLVDTSLDGSVMRAKEEVGLAGSSPALHRAIGTLARAAKSDASVVLNGETGSGKELFARLAHRLSARASGPFVAINCGALAEPMLEAELFGHERGAFTGAERTRPGLFLEAEGGTLFLDEVGEMSPAMQVKLLRVLEDREVRAVGSNKSRKVDVRVVAATHRDLAGMVAVRSFREDLFYRLAAITVRVPSLRERPEDIPVLARALLLRDPSTRRHSLDVPALAAISEHAWPGNVRELANVLRVAAAMTEGKVIGRPDLEDALGQSTPPIYDGETHALGETTLSALRARHRNEIRELASRAIARADGNKLRAALALGVSRQGLYRVLEETGH